MRNAITAPFAALYKNRELIGEMARRDIADRYKGQPLGLIWAFVHPLLLMGIYIVLFGVIFQMRTGGAIQTTGNYTIYLLSGMIPWLGMQTAMSAGSVSVIANGSFVKQVIFPSEVFPVKVVFSTLFIEAIYLFCDIIFTISVLKRVPWIYALLPVALLLQIMLLIGINYITSSINVYWKDIKDFVQVFCTLGIYVLPILYLPEAVPAVLRPILYINPFSHYIWLFQDILNYGSVQHWYAWIVCPVLSLAAFYGGYAVFEKLKVSFGSVL